MQAPLHARQPRPLPNNRKAPRTWLLRSRKSGRWRTSSSTKMPELDADLVESSQALPFLTVRVAQRCYALRAEDVVEVMRVPPMTRVPQSPAALLGIANLRGSVLPVASLRGLLGMGGTGDSIDLAGHRSACGCACGSRGRCGGRARGDCAGTHRKRQTELGAEPGERLNGSFQVGSDAHAAKVST